MKKQIYNLLVDIYNKKKDTKRLLSDTYIIYKYKTVKELNKNVHKKSYHWALNFLSIYLHTDNKDIKIVSGYYIYDKIYIYLESEKKEIFKCIFNTKKIKNYRDKYEILYKRKNKKKDVNTNKLFENQDVVIISSDEDEKEFDTNQFFV